MKKLIIFDLDGTLLDTIADLAGATNHALATYGYPIHETDAYRFFVGNGINKLFERALPETERNETNIMKIRSVFIPYYNKHNADLSLPYAGITHVLETLQAKGCQLAVASNKYQEATTKLITQYFPTLSFVRIFGQREGVPAKPDPAVVFEISLHRRFRRRHADGHQCRNRNHWCKLGVPSAHRTGSIPSGIHRRYTRRIAVFFR